MGVGSASNTHAARMLCKNVQQPGLRCCQQISTLRNDRLGYSARRVDSVRASSLQSHGQHMRYCEDAHAPTG